MKSEFIPITVVDNFFKNPDEIRKVALNLGYEIRGHHPGFRSDQLQLLNPNLYSLIAKKIFSLFMNLEKDVV